MFSKRKGIFAFALISCAVMLISSCKKDEIVHSATPEISQVSVDPLSVTENQPITFTIKYTDGDGDLGEDKENVYNLFLTDTRVNITYRFRIKQLAPDNSAIAITGNLNVHLNSTAITDGSSSQDVIYKLYVVDRAGHQSNVITCSSINVHK